MSNPCSISDSAAAALKSCRNALAQMLPMMIPALYVHELKESDKVQTLTSDYSCIYYSAKFVCAQYEENKYKLCAIVLHTILHCMFLHQTQAYSDEEIGRCADISVQLIMERLAPQLLKKAKTPPVVIRRKTFAEEVSFKKLAAQAGTDSPLCRKALELHKEIQVLDEHSAWSSDFSRNSDSDGNGMAQEWIQVLAMVASSEELVQGLLAGCGSGKSEELLTPSKSSGISYRALLEQYLQNEEVGRANPEEFDMASYALGMELYGNVPLIEESEVREDKSSGNIIIALDTSGSCSGKILESFVAETMQILDEFPAENRTVRIINCDEKIESEVVIQRGEDYKVSELCRCRGFGGTDFRPVFRRAEELNKTENVDLLLYFTDACGNFPAKRPSVNSLILVYDECCGAGAYLPKWADAWLREDNRYVKIRK